MNSYCLFCKSGEENRVMEFLKMGDAVPLAPLAVRYRPSQHGVRRAKARLLPGYVFFDHEGTPDWDTIRRHSAVLKILRYPDGTCELRGDDLKFVNWLKRYEGMIDISQVIKVGTKIAFVSGPLVGMEANVVKVNKGRKSVQIALGGDDAIFRNIWCSIEYIESNTDLDTMHKQETEKEA